MHSCSDWIDCEISSCKRGDFFLKKMISEHEKQTFKAGYLCGVKSSYLYLHNNFLDTMHPKTYELIEELFDFITKNVSMLDCVTHKIITQEQVHDIEDVFFKHIEENFKHIKASHGDSRKEKQE